VLIAANQVAEEFTRASGYMMKKAKIQAVTQFSFSRIKFAVKRLAIILRSQRGRARRTQRRRWTESAHDAGKAEAWL